MVDNPTPFPRFEPAHWWSLRERFKRKRPRSVTVDMIESSLGIERRAAERLLSEFAMMGLLDPQGRLTTRAEAWLDDSSYPQVCKEIRTELYPEELRRGLPNPQVDRHATERWFARRARSGGPVAAHMANVYQLLWEADPTKWHELESAERPRKAASSIEEQSEIRAEGSTHEDIRQRQEDVSEAHAPSQVPTTPAIGVTATSTAPIQITIQIQLSAETTSVQIDQVFASIARHLYR